MSSAAIHKKAIAYYRVSTTKQGTSGLGLAAQQESVKHYAKHAQLEIIETFTEIETGTGKRKRVEIYKAIEAAKANKAVLLIAKLDRLARNVAFVSALMESGIDFIAVDMPEANRLTIHIMAAMAEHEAQAISTRTKDALRAAKARGVKLGNPQNLTDAARRKAVEVNRSKAKDAYKALTGYISLLNKQGKSLRGIATKLNKEGHRTRQGKPFYAVTVKRILERIV